MRSFSDFVAAPKHKAAVVAQAPAAPAVSAPAQLPEPPASIIIVTVAALDAAIQRFNARVVAAHAAGRADLRAERNLDACVSIAAALRRYGNLTEKQASYARALIGWSLEAADKPAAQQKKLPATLAVVRPFARVTIGEIRFSKKRGEDFFWIKSADVLVGKLDAEGVALFQGRITAAGLDKAEIAAQLDRIEADPAAALKAHGDATGACGCCGLELTNPESIARGIGPICWRKIGF